MRTDRKPSWVWVCVLAPFVSPISQTAAQSTATARGGSSPLAQRPAMIVSLPVEPTKDFGWDFRRMMRQIPRVDRYDSVILSECRKRGLDPRLVKAIIAAESDFNPCARSPKGAGGLMQIMPDTAIFVGLDEERLFEPEANIAAGAEFLSRLFDMAARRNGLPPVRPDRAPPWLVQHVLAAYNAGPKALSMRAMRWWTKEYVRTVLMFSQSEVTLFLRPRPVKTTVAVPFKPFPPGLN